MPAGYGHQPFPLAVQRYPNFMGSMVPEGSYGGGPQKARVGRVIAGDAKPERSGPLAPLGISKGEPHLHTPASGALAALVPALRAPSVVTSGSHGHLRPLEMASFKNHGIQSSFP